MEEFQHTYFLQPNKTPLPLKPSQQIIIDTDPGCDDIHAFFIADLLQKQCGFEILGITCVSGNTTIDHCAMNAALAQTMTNFKAPIYKGASCPLIQDVHRDNFFSVDGIGSTSTEYYPTISKEFLDKMIQKESAINFILETVNTYKNEVDIWTLGPMTNIARCIIQDPQFPLKVQNLITMGGAYLGVGNMMNFVTEFNFGGDVESANLCAKRLKQWYLLAYETVLEIVISQELTQKIFQPDTKKGKFIKNIYQETLPKCDFEYSICDPLVPIIGAMPEAVTQWYCVYGEIQLEGPCRGSMKIDWLKLRRNQPNLIICSQLDSDLIFQIAEEALLDN